MTTTPSELVASARDLAVSVSESARDTIWKLCDCIERLSAELVREKDWHSESQRVAETAEKRAAGLSEVLGWYADKENWKIRYRGQRYPTDNPELLPLAEMDEGQKAREALEKDKPCPISTPASCRG